MKINRNNYEAFFLDYYEGNLNGKQVEELFAFLDKNPDLTDEFNGFENITLEIFANEKFPLKDSLKKNISTSADSINRLIAYVEGDLNEKEIKDLKLELKNNSALQKDLELFQKTKLHEDKTEVFFGKDKLKKKERVSVITYLKYASFAASVLLVIGMFFYLNKDKVEVKNSVANKTLPKNKIEEDSIAQHVIHDNPKIETANNNGFNIIKNPVVAPENNQTINKKIIEKAFVKVNVERIQIIPTNVIELPQMEREVAMDYIPLPNNNSSVADNNFNAKEDKNNNVNIAQFVEKLSEKELNKLAQDNPAVATLIDKKKKGSRKFWDIASMGIASLSGDRINFTPKYDKQDKMVAYSIAAGPINYTKFPKN